MAQRLKIWIYRPDFETMERKINKNFVYNARGAKYYDVLDREGMLKSQISDVLEKSRQKVWNYKVEVSNE